VHPSARSELEATLAARQELGPGHDDALVAGFLDRIDRELDRRVDARVAEQVAQQVQRRPRPSVLHPGNLALCIPIVAVAGGIGHVAGLVLAFTALVIVFLVAELRN
jgi:hypothetical protein